MVLYEGKNYFLESHVHRTDLVLLFFLVNVISHSVSYLINDDVLLFIIKLHSNLSVHCTFHSSNLYV